MKKIEKYFPILPVLIAYIVLLVVGKGMSGMSTTFNGNKGKIVSRCIFSSQKTSL